MYVNGKVNYIDEVNSDYFSVITLYDMLVELGYFEDDDFRFHYRLPWEGLDLGLRQLLNDSNVRALNKIAETEKSIDIYVEHIDPDYDALKTRLVYHQLGYEQVVQMVEGEPFELVEHEPFELVEKEVEHDDPMKEIDPYLLKQAFYYDSPERDYDEWYHDPYEAEYDPLDSPYCSGDDCHWK